MLATQQAARTAPADQEDIDITVVIEQTATGPRRAAEESTTVDRECTEGDVISAAKRSGRVVRQLAATYVHGAATSDDRTSVLGTVA